MAELSFISKIQNKIQEYNRSFDIPISIWGNTAEDNALYNFKHSDYSYAFEEDKVLSHYIPKIVLVFGPINKKQLQLMQERLEEFPERPYVVYVHGPLPPQLMKYSDAVVTDIRNHLKIDYEYHKFPIDSEELFNSLLGLLKGNYERP